MKDELFNKSTFNIKDLANIVKKKTQTIRSWETKGIIKRQAKKTNDQHEWREYTKEDLAQVLEDILAFQWQRKVIKNEAEIQYIIDFLRGKIDTNNLEVMSIKNE